MTFFLVTLAISIWIGSDPAQATAPFQGPTSSLQDDFARLAVTADGRVGVCALDGATMACVSRDERFPLQSVMKLCVGLAVMDAVDHRDWRLEDVVIVRTQDLSVGVQPLAALVTTAGFRTTVGDLVRRAIVDSDSTATDVLIARLGGTKAVQGFLDRHRLAGVRVDRDERHLQTETTGLGWRSEFVDAEVLAKARAAVPKARQESAFRAYQQDPRDTATPAGMVLLLQLLADGKLASVPSTAFLLGALARTTTFPDRLKAGLSVGWLLGHKTGTSGSWNGVTAATNDVGILTAPDGRRISIAVFIADSRASSEDRARLMADLARATIEHHQPAGRGRE